MRWSFPFGHLSTHPLSEVSALGDVDGERLCKVCGAYVSRSTI